MRITSAHCDSKLEGCECLEAWMPMVSGELCISENRVALIVDCSHVQFLKGLGRDTVSYLP